MNTTSMISEKETIIISSGKLFRKHGYYDIDLQFIADSIQFKMNDIQKYFPDKLSLFIETFKMHYLESTQKIFETLSFQIKSRNSPYEIVNQTVFAINSAFSHAPVYYRDVEKLILSSKIVADLDAFYVNEITSKIHKELLGKTALDVDLELGSFIVYRLMRDISQHICHLSVFEQQGYLQELSKMIAGYLFR